MLLLLSRTVYTSSGALFPAALISKPPDPDPNTSVSGTRVPCDSARKRAEAGKGRMIVMQQIDQVSQDAAKLSICRTVHTGECVCVRACAFLCGFLVGRVRAIVVCLGQRMQESIAGSEGNVSLSAESIHSHQTGSLSIMGELREHTLSFFSPCCLCCAQCLMGSLLLM